MIFLKKLYELRNCDLWPIFNVSPFLAGGAKPIKTVREILENATGFLFFSGEWSETISHRIW